MSKPTSESTRNYLRLAILTVSDTRTAANDASGDYLYNVASTSGHQIADRQLCVDNIYTIRAIVSNWVADESINVILITGGTGFSGRDSTPEAITPLFDKTIDGYGELFRQVSYREIGTSTIQSRAVGGLANYTAIFSMPGSTGACKTAWDGIISAQLDSSHRPCNFVGHLLNRGK